jgi:hypothetical protein
VLIERQPAEQAGEAAADNRAIKLHPELLLQSAQAEIDPAGEFAFAQRIAPGTGWTPFQRSFKNQTAGPATAEW